MKKFVLVLAAVMLLFAGCNKPAVVGQIGCLSDDLFELTCEGGEVILSFETNTEWSLNCTEDWLELSKKSGQAGVNEVFAAVPQNTTGEERLALVTVRCGDAKCDFSVKQAQNDVFVLSADTELTASAEGEELQFTLDVNVEYSIKSMMSWIKVRETKSLERKTVIFDVEANDTPKVRTGAVQVKSSLGDYLVKITQSFGNTHTVCYGEVEYNGDLLACGNTNWSVKVIDETCFKDKTKGTMFVLDINSPKADKEFPDYGGRLPVGRYEFSDNEGVFEDYTMDIYSMVYDVANTKPYDINGGYLEVTETALYAELYDTEGVGYRFFWTFDEDHLKFKDCSYTSTITHDYEITFDTGVGQPMGQYLEDVGIYTNLTIIQLETENDYFGEVLEGSILQKTIGKMLLCHDDENSVEGTYTFKLSRDFEPGIVNTVLTEFYSYDNAFNTLNMGYALPYSGSVTVSEMLGLYTVEGEFYDDYPRYLGGPHKVKFHFNGKISMYGDVEYYSASSEDSGRKMRGFNL